MNRLTLTGTILAVLIAVTGCGDSEDEANQLGVGAQCRTTEDCTEKGQTCLPFKGGYCGVSGCSAIVGCPTGSACVQHNDGKNYCFLLCAEKVDCNINRSVDNHASCVSSITFVDGTKDSKACEPPSGS